MHAVVNSRKSKGKELKDWILRDVVPRGFNKLIEEKDTQLALLSDDLVIEHEHASTPTLVFKVRYALKIRKFGDDKKMYKT